MKTQSVQLSAIRTDADTQTRVRLNEEAVSIYAERMLEGDKFPAVILYHDGSEHFLADGFHRVMAAVRNGFKDILAEVRQGTRLDALDYALEANRANGVHVSNEDKRHCVKLALKNFPDWSDRKISEKCGVSHPFVANIREQVVTVTTSETRIGKDGKRQPAKKPAKKSIGEQINEAHRADREDATEPEPEETEQPHIKTADEELEEEKPSRPVSVAMDRAHEALAILREIPPFDVEYARAMRLVFLQVNEWLEGKR